MSGALFTLALAFSWNWGETPEIGLAPTAYAWSCRSMTEFQAAPVELTWSPSAGFGGRSSALVEQSTRLMLYCRR